MDNAAAGGSPHMPETDIRIYLWILYKRWWLVIAALGLTMLSSWMRLQTQTTVYEAHALVRMEDKTPVVSMGTPNVRGSSALPLGTAARLISTSLCAGRAEEIIKEQDPNATLSVGEIIGSTSVVTTEPDLVQISCKTSVAAKAIVMANAVAQSFVDGRTQQARAEASQTRKFLDEQLAKSGKELARIQGEILQFKKSTGVMDVDTQVKAVVESLSSYEEDLNKARIDQAAARSQLSLLGARLRKEQRDELIDVLEDDPLFEALKKQLVEKQVELVQLQSRYTEQHPEVQRAEDELEGLEKKLNGILQRTVRVKKASANPMYVQMRGQVIEAQMQTTQAEAKAVAYSMLLQNEKPKLTDLLNKKEKWDQLQELSTVTKETFKGMLGQLQEAKVQEAAKLGDASIADLATGASQIRVNRSRTLALGVILGLVIGVGLAVLLEFLDTTVRTPKEVEQLTGARQLALIPFIKEERYRDNVRKLMTSKSPPAEAVRTLRSNLRFVSATNPCKVLMVTSTSPNEGKTFVSASLAISLAQGGSRVVLVDADLRHPGLSRLFSAPESKGITNVLVGEMDWEQALQPSGVENLMMLATGPLPPNPAEILDSHPMKTLMGHVRDRADFVVVDTPPVSLVTDPTVVATYADGVLLVVEPARVSRNALERVRDQLQMAGGNIVGTVINKITHRSSYYYYYYSYGDYYYRRYYHHYYHDDADVKEA